LDFEECLSSCLFDLEQEPFTRTRVRSVGPFD
jgi:hypothetical protein